MANFDVKILVDYDVVLYHLHQNNHQDTTKINSGKVLFGISRLKSHFELHGKKSIIDEEKRNKWIQEAAEKLKSTKNVDNYQQLVMNELTHEDFYQASYRLIDSGMIKFDDGSYLKLKSTSTHSMAEIGDITLAVDRHGDVYINQGHICGGIIHFNTHQKDVARTDVDFLKYFQSDTDDEQWLYYKITNNN